MSGKNIGMMVAGIMIPTALVTLWLSSAKASMAESLGEEVEEVPLASIADDEYCTPRLKKVLRRVAGACGLIEGGGRGCQPGDVRKVAALAGTDFNDLFVPLEERVHIVQFDNGQTDIDAAGKTAIEEAWGEQRGASFFFVVSRASPDGDASFNQKLSQDRAENVLAYLQAKYNDPDLRKEVGLMWLGEEFAQLGQEFCSWRRSREGKCTQTDINRSAFVAWIDCAI